MFVNPPLYTYGNLGRVLPDVRNPGVINVDLSVVKNWEIRERIRLQFRAESFNLSNTPAFGQPAANINGLGAGTITSAGDPRRIQFGLKFTM